MNRPLDAVLIDNDPLVHSFWEFAALQHNKTLLMFLHPQEFFLAAPIIPHDTSIYIDSNLGLDQRGELIAQEIHTKGYPVIYLITGDEASQFKNMPWLVGILDKTPPWF